MPTICDKKDTTASSVFQPAALLREARRQKGLTTVDVPAVCILDPDGDIVRRLRQDSRSLPFDAWPCYHTRLDTFSLAGRTVGIVGCAVGAPFAVLIAEELFVSGCRLLLSLTSAGQITPSGPTPYFVIIDRALRDEGTSYHYAPSSEYADADPELVAMAAKAICDGQKAVVGSSWTTECAFSRNCRRDRGCSIERRPRSRDGGRRSLHLCPCDRLEGPLSCACDEYDGPDGPRLRKRRGGWYGRSSEHS